MAVKEGGVWEWVIYTGIALVVVPFVWAAACAFFIVLGELVKAAP